MKCISCNYEHEENFCPNCGEKSNVDKITFSAMSRNAFLAITNMDKGFLYNLKHLTLNPRKTILDYISGKRKAIYNPILFLLVCITLYIIIENQFDFITANSGKVEFLESDNVVRKKSKSIGYNAGKFISEYLKYFWMFTIFLLANTTKLLFKRFNYAEHLAISAFIIGYSTLIGIIGYFIFHWVIILNPLVYLTMSILIYNVFKGRDDKIATFILAGSCLFLFLIQFFIIVLGLGFLNS